MKQGKEGWVKDDMKKDLELISLPLCLTDYAEELRFYLIHMTEVSEKITCLLESKRERERKLEKEGLMCVYFVCEPEGQSTLLEITLQGRHKD